MKLRIVTPITTHGFASIDEFLPLMRPDTDLSHVEIDHGPASIESDYDEMLATPASRRAYSANTGSGEKKATGALAQLRLVNGKSG